MLVASPGVPLFEFAIPTEVFGTDRSDLTPDWYQFAVAGVDEPVTSLAHGLSVPAGQGLGALTQADTVIVPACVEVHQHAPDNLLSALRAAHQRGARIASICSGAFVLAEAGLLDQRRATTHWMHAGELARRYPTIDVDPTVLYVHDELWTSAGSAAGLDMCLELVRQDHGAAIANEVARRVVTPPHRTGGQAQYIRPVTNGPATPRPDVQDWARRTLPSVTVAAMARYCQVSQRTLNRNFRTQTGMPPQQWLQHARLEAAAELLEATRLTTEAIARRVGLGSASNLRAHFNSTYGVSPAHYRQTFNTATFTPSAKTG